MAFEMATKTMYNNNAESTTVSWIVYRYQMRVNAPYDRITHRDEYIYAEFVICGQSVRLNRRGR